MNTGSQIVGGFVTVAVGVVVVAAIFQLGKPNNPTVSDVTGFGNNTVNALFSN